MRFHAMQSILFFGGLSVLEAIISFFIFGKTERTGPVVAVSLLSQPKWDFRDWCCAG